MLLATQECPSCKTRLPVSSLRACPACGDSLDKRSTQRVRDLDRTTAFGSNMADDAQAADAQAADASDPDAEELVGTQLGNYLLEKFLGQGGMARVYRGRHLTLERPCAIKVLKPSIAQRDRDAVASFLAEARAAANLVHPNVVTIHTIGQDRNWHYIELEYIDGMSLATLLESEGFFDPAQATCYLMQISSALAVAHTRHLVHRDIKPGNIMVDQDRRAKLADFGLAKRIHDQQSDDGGWLSGTPNFMAPELFQGAMASTQSDVYAMGVTYFLLLTGRLPASGESIVELMHWHQTQSAPDVREFRPEIPEVAARVVERCLAKEPSDRFTDAVELHRHLRAVYGSLRTLESLVRESMRETNILIEGEGDRFELTVPLPEGRKQKVIIQTCLCPAAIEQLVRIYSVCGPAEEHHFRRALELNPRFSYGAIGLADVNGVPNFVMTNAFARSTCDPEEIRLSVLGIAQHADDGERFLTGQDTQ